MKKKNNYDEIMGLPRHISKKHPQMPISERAVQFAPFAALVGYDSIIAETGRLTDDKIDPAEEALIMLNMKLQFLTDTLEEEPDVCFIIFKPDERKAGGEYLSVTGKVKKVDDYERLITMHDGTKISINDIIDITGEIFSYIE